MRKRSCVWMSVFNYNNYLGMLYRYIHIGKGGKSLVKRM